MSKVVGAGGGQLDSPGAGFEWYQDRNTRKRVSRSQSLESDVWFSVILYKRHPSGPQFPYSHSGRLALWSSKGLVALISWKLGERSDRHPHPWDGVMSPLEVGDILCGPVEWRPVGNMWDPWNDRLWGGSKAATP